MDCKCRRIADLKKLMATVAGNRKVARELIGMIIDAWAEEKCPITVCTVPDENCGSPACRRALYAEARRRSQVNPRSNQ